MLFSHPRFEIAFKSLARFLSLDVNVVGVDLILIMLNVILFFDCDTDHSIVEPVVL